MKNMKPLNILTTASKGSHSVFFPAGHPPKIIQLYISIQLHTHTHAFQGLTCSIWRFPGQGSNLSLQLVANTTATATWDPSPIFDLHQSSWQRRILHPLSEAGDQTCHLMVLCQILFRCTTTATPEIEKFCKTQQSHFQMGIPVQPEV